jgi:DNA gyrase subunit A
MYRELRLTPSANYRKSAAVVGEVLAKFHPHGDIACYDAMVRMAQPFSLRYPLVDGQGNFGSLDGDNAAAYRYTEAKLQPIALDVVGDIEDETVLLRSNFDYTTFEPAVLPSRLPNLLINGASGIAVGMATNIPPHNLKEVLKALIELSRDGEACSDGRLLSIIKGPDFPTGCQILNSKSELETMYSTGRGTIRMRGEWSLEELERGKRQIIVTSIPFNVNKSTLVEKIAELIIDKKVPQLIDIRDESTDTVRIVIELRAGADAEVAMAYLMKSTQLESPFAVNMTALVPKDTGAMLPETLSLRGCLSHFIAFREEVTAKKFAFELRRIEERLHILLGLEAVLENLDLAIKIIRSSDGRETAAKKIADQFNLSEIQSLFIVDLRLYQLSKVAVNQVRKELQEKRARKRFLEELLGSKEKIAEAVREEFFILSEKYGDKRLSKIVRYNEEVMLKATDFILAEDVYVTVTTLGWIKRMRRNVDFRQMRLREGDSIFTALPGTTLDHVAFFTDKGNVYAIPVVDFPSSSGFGLPIQKELRLDDDERVVEVLLLPEGELEEGRELICVSAAGLISRYIAFAPPKNKRTGRRVMKLRSGDVMVQALLLPDKIGKDKERVPQLALFTSQSLALRFSKDEIPAASAPSLGVIGIDLKKSDKVVAASLTTPVVKLLGNASLGRAKECKWSDIKLGKRGSVGAKISGIANIKALEKVAALSKDE